MSILELLLVGVVWCFLWLVAQVVWKVVEGRMLMDRQNRLIDAGYAKLVRFAFKAVNDCKQLKEVWNREM